MRIGQLLFESELINNFGRANPDAFPFFKYLHQQHLVLDHEEPTPINVGLFSKEFNNLRKRSFLVKGIEGWGHLIFDNYQYTLDCIFFEKGKIIPHTYFYSDHHDHIIKLIENSIGRLVDVYEVPYRKSAIDGKSAIISNRYKDRDLEGIYQRQAEKNNKPQPVSIPTWQFSKSIGQEYREKFPYNEIVEKTWKVSDRIFREIKTKLGRALRREEIAYHRYRGNEDIVYDLFQSLDEIADKSLDDLSGDSVAEHTLATGLNDLYGDENANVPDIDEGMYYIWEFWIKAACRALKISPETLVNEPGMKKFQHVIPELVSVIEDDITSMFFEKPRKQK